MSDTTLCVTVRFLSATYHGRDRDGGSEWPPSPLRLFQALVAAAGLTRAARQDEALRWLERQAAPAVVAAVPLRDRPVQRLSYVPNNTVGGPGDRAARRVEKRYAPLHLPQGNDATSRPEVQYRWPVDAADRAHAEIVAALAGRLRCLGWGIDVVAGRGGIDAELPSGTRWEPVRGGGGVAGGGRARRVPRAGTLASLDAAYAAWSQRFADGGFTPTDANVSFDVATYRPAVGPPARPFRVFTLADAEGRSGRTWPAMACHVAGQVRHAAHEAAAEAQWDETDIRGYVCGHFKDGGDRYDRLSYLPLPSIGHPHTDGLIRRVMIAERPGGDGRRLDRLEMRLLGRLLKPETDDEADGEAESAEPTVLAPCERFDKVVLRYTQERRVWATVTPVLMPGFNARGEANFDYWHIEPEGQLDDATRGHSRKTHKLVLKMLASAGIDASFVQSVLLQRVPLWPNLPAASRYVRPKSLRRRPMFHARLTFKHPVAGPVALGDGRFRGLGTFAGVAE